ncbi:hypothetical protein BVC80_7767g3 [Macleaya cordata]|uniref:Uncharacterized protein n=1 Tax=Macleaya cordata TaxID=56857 RepID=A0A200QG57_MACCD|nr:hypothetical protein BVC80_7767g3 [Macleaya cordata]
MNRRESEKQKEIQMYNNELSNEYIGDDECMHVSRLEDSPPERTAADGDEEEEDVVVVDSTLSLSLFANASKPMKLKEGNLRTQDGFGLSLDIKSPSFIPSSQLT